VLPTGKVAAEAAAAAKLAMDRLLLGEDITYCVTLAAARYDACVA
jgi:hypothetical protein